jgi:hypothetical protein
MESPAFFILLFIHLTSLIVAFGAVMVTDHFGLRWMRHKAPFARIVEVAHTTQKLIWIGWFGLVGSGIPLIILKGEFDNLMVWKVFFVALAGLNGLMLHRILGSFKEFKHSDAAPTVVIYRMALSTLISQIAWWGALLIGFLHRHIWSVIEWPSRPWLWVGVATAVMLAAWGAGEIFFRKRPSQVKVEADHRAQRRFRGPGPTLDPLGKEG